jgi:hypothetical protein
MVTKAMILAEEAAVARAYETSHRVGVVEVGCRADMCCHIWQAHTW